MKDSSQKEFPFVTDNFSVQMPALLENLNLAQPRHNSFWSVLMRLKLLMP